MDGWRNIIQKNKVEKLFSLNSDAPNKELYNNDDDDWLTSTNSR